MKSEIDIAFVLLKSALNGTTPEIEPMEASRWWSLFRLLQQNHVAAMTADTVAKLDVPREVKIPWLAERDKAERWHRYQKEVQQEIVDTMARHGIETLVLKGTHTAQYYPQPELREFGDLDLYFYRDRGLAPVAEAKRMGQVPVPCHDEADRKAAKELGVSIRNEAHHHSKYNYRGVTIESHYDFLNTHYPPSNRRYEKMLKELIDRGLAPVAEEKRMGQVPVPCHAARAEEYVPTFEVLFLLRHMACHFAASRITLRDLVDWALTCRALKDKVDWTLVNDTVKHYGMESFVSALNTIAEQRLGLPTPQSLEVLKPRSLEVLKSQNLEVSKSRSLEVSLEKDLLYGSVSDHATDGLARLSWKFRRWRALAWKRRMVFSDSSLSLLLASLTSHAEKPASILHKM